MTGPQITVTLDPACDPLPMYPCPHGCGAQLGVSSSTSDGERGRCGQCQGRTVYRGGVLRAPEDLADILQYGTRDAMTPEQIEDSVAHQVASSQRLAGEDTTIEDIKRMLQSPEAQRMRDRLRCVTEPHTGDEPIARWTSAGTSGIRVALTPESSS